MGLMEADGSPLETDRYLEVRERAARGLEITRATAALYAGKDWHRLSESERKIVKGLEESGYLTVNKPANGFVGKAT